MLLTFSTGNYCCFQETQTLSLQADGRHTRGDARVVAMAGCQALRVVGILGDTATGKSHLGKALQFMCRAVLEGWHETALHCSPFLAGGLRPAKPSFFEVLIATDKARYRYGFELQDRQVLREWLYERKGRRELRLFSRQEQCLLVHASFSDGRRLIGITPPDILLLTIMARLQFAAVLPVVQWLRQCQVIDAAIATPFDPGWEEKLAIPAPVLTMQQLYEELGMEYVTGSMQALIKAQVAQRRATDAGIGAWALVARQELLTSGTRSLLAITPAVLKVINEGGLLFIDDLDAHLSLPVLQGLMGVFQHAELNPHHAQLVFTTHLQDWMRQGKWLSGQRYVLEKPLAAASLQYWSMPARG